MIFEHEIPTGSKLYFGNSAKIKREIEYKASNKLYELGFEEIVTPIFSYHQAEAFDTKTPLLRLSDNNNHEVTLRADSTLDVVRIVTKRLGRSTTSKKWFYIQPTLTFPTNEVYQIGAEILDGTFEEIVKTTISLLNEIENKPLVQIANIAIPHILHKNYGISLEVLKSINIEEIINSNIPWIDKLMSISKIEDLEDISIFPEDIANELLKIKSSAEKLEYQNIIISPLFYAKMRYYNELTFRIFEENNLLAMGGVYSVDNIKASGFALNIDECIIKKLKNR